MRICHIITRLILGGAQENTILSCEAQHAAGHEVTLITGPALGPEGELLSRARAGGYRVIEVPTMRREISAWRDMKAARALQKLLLELRPDIVHTHSSKAGILGRFVASRLRRRAELRGMKIVHTIHGLPFFRYQSKWKNYLFTSLEKSAAKHCDHIVCVADAMSAQTLAAGIGRAEQFSTIYSGMEVDTFLDAPTNARTLFRRHHKIAANEILVTQVSRIAEHKGHDDLLAALDHLATLPPAERIRFCFVGDGHLRETIQQAARKLGLEHRVLFTGLLPPSDIPAVMAGSDILVHASYREGLARTLPQAMLSGIPAISYDVDGAREVVNEKTGILLPSPHTMDPRSRSIALAEAITELAADPVRRATLGAAGRELCRTRFDYHTMAAQLDALYCALLEGDAS
ncbi:MAG: glycosyltransferase family 4 protein [Phycisphaerales bacterium]|nr:glycosyltransferase family 4 protein [Phycisphaerales bacterium]MBT7171312.1 glycosyltransferase family 4 protein [Phycisphaerales bacterium]